MKRSMSFLSIPRSKRPVLLALVGSVVLHGLIGTTLYVFWPQPTKNHQQPLQIWLSEPAKKKSERPTTVVESPSRKQGERPEHAELRAEHDNKALQEHMKMGAQSAAGPSNAGISGQKPALAQKGFLKRASQTTDDPLGLKPLVGDDHHMAEAGSDYIAKMERGDSTELNTWQWQHAPFFNRIKSRISKTWSPHAQIARFDPQGESLGQMDRVTVLAIQINPLGQIVEVLVEQSSGVSYLDEEALRAVREAAPFINPPPQLFDEQGQFSFHFAFHVLLNRRISLDFNW